MILMVSVQNRGEAVEALEVGWKPYFRNCHLKGLKNLYVFMEVALQSQNAYPSQRLTSPASQAARSRPSC